MSSPIPLAIAHRCRCASTFIVHTYSVCVYLSLGWLHTKSQPLQNASLSLLTPPSVTALLAGRPIRRMILLNRRSHILPKCLSILGNSLALTRLTPLTLRVLLLRNALKGRQASSELRDACILRLLPLDPPVLVVGRLAEDVGALESHRMIRPGGRQCLAGPRGVGVDRL